MIYLLGFVVVAYGVTVALFLRYLTARDAINKEERQELYQRIQAPEVAVAQAIPETEGMAYVPFDDDEAYAANRAEMMASGDRS